VTDASGNASIMSAMRPSISASGSRAITLRRSSSSISLLQTRCSATERSPAASFGWAVIVATSVGLAIVRPRSGVPFGTDKSKYAQPNATEGDIRWTSRTARVADILKPCHRSPTVVRHDEPMTKKVVSILERPVYGVVEAASLLGLRSDRTRAWLDGYERRGTAYPPVIRVEPTGDDIITWGEFVELGYLREYRRKGVPLQRLRPVIDELRHEFGTPYPLATGNPYIYGKELVLELQEKNDIPRSIAIVVSSGQTIALTSEATRFLKKVEFDPPDDGDVRRLYPAGTASPVVIDPLQSFGRPAVQGVATERLWELFDAGELVQGIADGYELSPELVRAAIAYEEQQRCLAA